MSDGRKVRRKRRMSGGRKGCQEEGEGIKKKKESMPGIRKGCLK